MITYNDHYDVDHKDGDDDYDDDGDDDDDDIANNLLLLFFFPTAKDGQNSQASRVQGAPANLTMMMMMMKTKIMLMLMMMMNSEASRVQQSPEINQL